MKKKILKKNAICPHCKQPSLLVLGDGRELVFVYDSVIKNGKEIDNGELLSFKCTSCLKQGDTWKEFLPDSNLGLSSVNKCMRW